MPREQTLSPAARRLRTKIATSVQNGRQDEAERARQEFRAVKAEDYIRQLVNTAPPLDEDTRRRLALLLSGSAA